MTDYLTPEQIEQINETWFPDWYAPAETLVATLREYAAIVEGIAQTELDQFDGEEYCEIPVSLWLRARKLRGYE